jgi:hypothetical protein
MPRLRGRSHYLLDRGWAVLYIWVSYSNILTEACADEVLAWSQILERHPSRRRQYRVIRGSGEDAPFAHPDRDDST